MTTKGLQTLPCALMPLLQCSPHNKLLNRPIQENYMCGVPGDRDAVMSQMDT